jgi:hypothetical protein
LTEVTADLVYTFDVTPVTDGIVAVSILGDMVQTDELKNNSASNSVSWGVGGVVGDSGLRVFDRTGSQENQTANILIGPLPISPNAASKSKVRRSQVVLGRNTDATGTFHFYGGVDAQDAIDRAEGDAPTYSVTVAALLANGGVSQPMVSGHGLVIEIDVTSGHLTFEQDTLELEPAGVNRLVRYSG